MQGATAAAVAEAVRQHDASVKACSLMRQVQTKLRNMLLESSDDLCWSVLRHEELLCSNRTVRELLDHISTVHGEFSDTERKDINKRMAMPWEGGPFEVVIAQIQSASTALGLAGHGSVGCGHLIIICQHAHKHGHFYAELEDRRSAD
jgi:hypothetical protein